MKIAVASGKGGTGKTTVSLNLAISLSESLKSDNNNQIKYYDCDVEEPNAHIFLKSNNSIEDDVNINIPDINQEKCTLCGKCTNICQFSALIKIIKEIVVIPEICHDCKACKVICPEDAITLIPHKIGNIYKVDNDYIKLFYGKLDIGNTLVTHVIRQLKQINDNDNSIKIYDCPPGTSCSMIEAIKDSDFIILVSEPTPFGLSDLKLAVQTVRKLNIPFGLIINRSDIGNNDLIDYCNEENIDILLEIPNNIELAKTYAKGMIPVLKFTNMQEDYIKVFDNIKNIIQHI